MYNIVAKAYITTIYIVIVSHTMQRIFNVNVMFNEIKLRQTNYREAHQLRQTFTNTIQKQIFGGFDVLNKTSQTPLIKMSLKHGFAQCHLIFRPCVCYII